MDLEANYGSSEYSEKAEEIFASYLLRVEQAKTHPEEYPAPDFEAFSAEHEEFADELYGLHADWDNVRGLVAQMNNQRERQAPAPVPMVAQPSAEEIASREAMAEPFSTQDVPDPQAIAELPPTKSWKAAALGTLFLALAAGGWGLKQTRTSTVLAQEKDALEVAQISSQEKLQAAHIESAALSAQGKQLQDDLRHSETARDQLESSQVDLSRNLDQAREGQKVLSADLQSERKQRADAAALILQAQLETQGLALGLSAAALLKQEAQLWPVGPASLQELPAWAEKVQALERQWLNLGTSKSTRPAALSELFIEGGPLERCQRRLETLRLGDALLHSKQGNRWTQALAQINDKALFPMYAGIQLVPQWGLIPLGVDADSGLWRFADLQTGTLGEEDPSNQAQALSFVLVPGMELEGRQLAPFFLCEQAWGAPIHDRIFGTQDPSAQSELEQGIQYSTDLLRLGYQPLSRVQAMLARPFGQNANTRDRRPVRALSFE